MVDFPPFPPPVVPHCGLWKAGSWSRGWTWSRGCRTRVPTPSGLVLAPYPCCWALPISVLDAALAHSYDTLLPASRPSPLNTARGQQNQAQAQVCMAFTGTPGLS